MWSCWPEDFLCDLPKTLLLDLGSLGLPVLSVDLKSYLGGKVKVREKMERFRSSLRACLCLDFGMQNRNKQLPFQSTTTSNLRGCVQLSWTLLPPCLASKLSYHPHNLFLSSFFLNSGDIFFPGWRKIFFQLHSGLLDNPCS